MQYEYVHITRSGGRRVFMNNPGLAGTGGSVYDQTCEHFMRLLSSGKFVLKYRAAEAIPGFEVLAADNGVSILTVWKEKGEIRLLTEKGGRSPGGAVSVQGEGGALVSVDQGQPGTPEWVSFEGGKIGQPEQSPPSFGPLEPSEGVPAKMGFEGNRHSSLWALTVGGYTYRVASWNGKDGFWRCRTGSDPALLLEGNVALPVVTPDGKWAVIAKTDSNWAEPNYVVRIELATGRTFRLNVPVADTFNPVAYVPTHRKVLLERARDEAETGSSQRPVGPDRPEFRLLDPATGATEIVTGSFEPLFDQSIRPLQPTGKPDEVWAARFNEKSEATQVGRYDMKTFRFAAVMSAPMRFSSMQMWVDEAEGKLYLAYNGHLLRMILPGK
jgi:hypothetical protein